MSRQGDYDHADAMYEEALAINRQLGDLRSIGVALNNLGNNACDRLDFQRARELHEENLRIREELGDLRGIAIALNNLATIADASGDRITAQRLFTQCLEHHKRLGNRRSIAVVLSNLGSNAILRGDFIAAIGFLLEALAEHNDLGDHSSIATNLEAVAAAMAGMDDPLSAAHLWGAAERLREVLGEPQSLDEVDNYNQRVSDAKGMAGNEAFQDAWNKGRATSEEQAVKYALDLRKLR